MDDLISRQAAIDGLDDHYVKRRNINDWQAGWNNALDWVGGAYLSELPSAQPEIMSNGTLHVTVDTDISTIGRVLVSQSGTSFGNLYYGDDVPSAQPEPLSDSYMKAVWTWLLGYQIKAAELEGRYTPYEVLSWVANDWRKEHERFDR